MTFCFLVVMIGIALRYCAWPLLIMAIVVRCWSLGIVKLP